MSEAEPLAALAPGAVIADKYVVEGTLGHGGMGVVFVARHRELDRRVAIKVLRTNAGDATAEARFIREAKAVAALESDRVVRILDLGRMPSGEAFIVMELLRGESLADRVKRLGPLPSAMAVRFALDACAALGEAHRLGIVHRDVKPSNLFVTRVSGGSECVKLLDFGIAKVAATGDDALQLTDSGALLGSPAYMAPEQLRPVSMTVGPAADIWGVGVVLYEVLTGRLPFQSREVATTILAIMSQKPADPSTLRKEIPSELSRVVMRCLAKNPRDRFATTATLAAELRPLCDEKRLLDHTLPSALDQSGDKAGPSPVERAEPSAVEPAEASTVGTKEPDPNASTNTRRTKNPPDTLDNAAGSLPASETVSYARKPNPGPPKKWHRFARMAIAGAGLAALVGGLAWGVSFIVGAKRDPSLTDAKKCGPRKRSCQGGECNAGRCSVDSLTPGDDIGRKVAHLAFDDTFVYWGKHAPAGIERVSKNGGEVSTVLPGVDAQSVAVRDGWIYYVSQDAGVVGRVRVGGTEPDHLADGEAAPQAVNVDDANVYYVAESGNPSTTSVRRVPIAGGTPETLASASGGCWGLRLDEQAAYWVSGDGLGANSIYRVDKATREVLSLVKDVVKPGAPYPHGEWVYFTNHDAGTVNRVPKRGGRVDILVANQADPSVVMGFGARLYWIQREKGFLMSAKLDGTDLEFLADRHGDQLALTSDGLSLYWTQLADGNAWEIWKTAL